MSKVVPTQKYGYVDIKQASKVRPRKLKTWKHRWAVLTKMSNLSNEEYLAKLDLYDSEAKWRGNSSDKVTFVLENVTCIRPVKSKTHQHAFEVVEGHPVLVISGATELDSYSWIVSLQQIFTPDHIQAKKDSYHVTVSENEHSRKWRLSGTHTLTVSATCLSLGSAGGTCVVSWGLNTLVRFHVEPSSVPGHRPSLVIECGPKSTTGQSFFHLLSDQAEDILGTIRQSICLAVTLKQSARMSSSGRHRSPSVTTSEKSYQRLLENQSVGQHIPQSAPQPIPMGRSDSSSSNSLSTFDSPGRSSKLSNSPSSSLTTGHFSADFSSFLEMEENDAAHACQPARELTTADEMSCQQVKACSHRRCSSHPEQPYMGNHDYSEIKDITDGLKTVSRRNTISSEPAEVDFDRLRSVSAVVASLKASNNNNGRSGASSSPQSKDDDKSDFDSAISSMALSVTNEDLPRKDEQHSPATVCTDEQCSCLLARRRSSSTPDLQAFWKMNRFENVYEELDELRASVQRLNQKHDSDIPPQLPARPLSANSTRNPHLDTKGTATRKTSLAKMHGTHSFDEDKSRTGRLCVCGNIRVARWPLDDGQCACLSMEGSGQRNKRSVFEMSPSQKLTGSLSSTINDINSIILQVQHMKRRRSSDITPAAPSLLSTISTNINYDKTTRQQSPTEDLTESVKFMSLTPVNLIDLQDKTDSSGVHRPTREAPAGQAQRTILDSPIHFFLDDGSFTTQAEVASQRSVQPSHNPGHLTTHGHSFPNTPVSSQAHFTPAQRTQTWPGQITRSHTIANCVLPVSHANPVDIWGVEATNSSRPRDRVEVSSPDFWAPSVSLL